MTRPRDTTPARALSLLLAAMAAGCAGPPETAPNPFAFEPAAYPDLFDAAVDELRDRGLVVDRQDHRFGVITTRPATSPTALEPWHADNTTAALAGASTLHHLRRRYTITLAPADEGAGAEPWVVMQEPAARRTYQLEAVVLIERRSLPTARQSGSTIGPRVISHLATVPVEWRERGITPAYWQPIGRDPLLEHQLVAAIVGRAHAPHEDASPADGE